MYKSFFKFFLVMLFFALIVALLWLDEIKDVSTFRGQGTVSVKENTVKEHDVRYVPRAHNDSP